MLGKTHPRCCDRESNCPKPATPFSVAEFNHIVKQLTPEHQVNIRCVSGIETLLSQKGAGWNGFLERAVRAD